MSEQPTLPEDVPGVGARAVAVQVLEKTMSNEETRFSALNVRAINLLSASSIVISLIALFARDLLSKDFLGPKDFLAITVGVALLGLGVAAAALLYVVLRPSPRALVGANSLFDRPQLITTPEQAQAIAFDDYLKVTNSLRARNSEKVKALHLAYRLFLGAIISVLIGTYGVLVSIVLG